MGGNVSKYSRQIATTAPSNTFNYKRCKRLRGLIISVISLVFLLSFLAGEVGAAETAATGSRQQHDHIMKRQEPLPILDRLFPDQSIDEAFEIHPLLATAYPTRKQTNTSIPTIAMLPDANNRERNDRIQSLFPMSSIHSILSQKNMVHGTDFKVVKKVEKDGQEWIGMLPGKVTADGAIHAASHNGFSLVIDAMEQRWAAIFAFARQLHEEVQCHVVSCNLYLTPKAHAKQDNNDNLRRSGFESHWDYMDVIILQLSGEKLWTIAREPLVYLSNQDQKRKPTLEELGRTSYYDDILLRQGDALYIPRGFIHNASTVVTDANGNGSPSLHLTFGLEHVCETTMEALLHTAIHMFAMASTDGAAIAISRQECPQSPYDVTWGTILHQSLSEVARRDGCNMTASFGSGGSRPCAGVLRTSLPLHPAFRQMHVVRRNISNENDVGNVLHILYREALEAFVRNAEVTLVEFMNQLFASRDLQTSFCFPFMDDSSGIICPGILTTREKAHSFNDLLEKFERFAVARFDSVLESFERHASDSRQEVWNKNDSALRLVGQKVSDAIIWNEL